MRLSNASLGTLVPPLVPKPLSVFQKFHLSMSTVDSSTHGINSVDVIINGAGAESAQQNLTGNQLPMWGMPRPDFFPPDFRLPQYLQWMSQYDAMVKPSGGGGYAKNFQKKDTTYQERQQRRTQSNSGSDRSHSDSHRDNSYRGDKSSGGNHPPVEVVMVYLIEITPTLRDNRLIEEIDVITSQNHLVLTETNAQQVPMIARTENAIVLNRPLV